MTARAQCECCERVRKPTLKVVKCKRCGKHVCANENCQVPHAQGVCGDKFANQKARAIANDLPPRSFAPKDAFNPTGFDGVPIILDGVRSEAISGVIVNLGNTPIRILHDSPDDMKVTFVRVGSK